MEQILSMSNSSEKTEQHLNKEEAFACFFDAYYKRVYNYIYYRVHSQDIAEDLTSQVFEKMMYKIEQYHQDKSPFEVWMFAIAKNVVHDHFRSLKKSKIFSFSIVEGLISRDRTPEDTVLMAESKDQLMKALQGLNQKEKNIVALKFGANLKNSEIAKVLKLTESNVGVILYRTMKKLKMIIEGGEKI
ncbi:MAG: sigma-70 family RNA polymerase sigma factor [Thermotaleaceae bacterium]